MSQLPAKIRKALARKSNLRGALKNWQARVSKRPRKKQRRGVKILASLKSC